MAAKKRVSGVDRKAQVLECGAKLAAKHGAINVTRRMVAKACKVSEPLVTSYMGNAADAQKAYARHAKKLGLTLPTKEQAEAIGAKLRAHGPRATKVVRKRTVKEVQAIKRKITVGNDAIVKTSATKRAAKRASKVAAKKSVARKSAARAPKAPPPLPSLEGLAPLPPLPSVLP